jgi:hypothetical protein
MSEIERTAGRWMRPAAARKVLGLSEPSYYRLKRSGGLRSAKVNGIVFVDVGGFEDELSRQLESEEVPQ